ncbi:MAG TPA: hypothetical protein RMH99_05970 [Sandaracinaceae bacterium LLY-WYZ-13_1]|nr:hypothetical protein [Sandaracinaceae bacterium LLY-WYZ-13_1]
MVKIDWGDLEPSEGQRARVEAEVRRLAAITGPVIGLRRRGTGYEAQLTNTLPSHPAELRLHGDDLRSVVERAVDLLEIVSRPDPR